MVASGETTTQALLNVAEAWVSNTNFVAQYGTTANSIVLGIYAKAFGVNPSTADVAAWSSQTTAEILYRIRGQHHIHEQSGALCDGVSQ